MTTINALTDRILGRLEKGTTVLVNVLDGNITDVATTLTLTYDLPGAGPGSVIEIDSELIYVLAESTLTRTVIRGWQGTTAAAHTTGAVIRCSPRFSRQDVIDSVAEELHSWPVELHRWDTVEVTVPALEWKAQLTPTVSGATVHRLLDTNVLPVTNAENAQRNRIDVRLLRDADNDEFTSGYAIQLPQNFGQARVVQCDLIISYDLSALTTLSTDLETDVGLRSELLDVLTYGVLWRTMSVLEIGRTNPASNQPMDSEAVPPTHLAQTADALLRIRNQRLSEERTRVYDYWPLLMTTQGA